MRIAAIAALFGEESKQVREMRESLPIPLFVAADRPIPEACVVARGDVLWQKERLLNLALAMVPPEYDAIAWLDLDLLFTRLDWPDLAVKALQRNTVVQLFSRVLFQRKEGDRWPEEGRSVVWNSSLGHPGFAWAARRDYLERVGGFYDEAILGGGDLLMWDAWSGGARSRLYALRLRAKRWSCRLQAGCLDQTIVHRWHGTRMARQYVERDAVLQSTGFDPERHLTRNAAGAWCWTAEAPVELQTYCREYFTRRRNDAAGIGELCDGDGASPRTASVYADSPGGVRPANLSAPGTGGPQPIRGAVDARPPRHPGGINRPRHSRG